ncbi:hypothetical protein [Actinokineospora globicatena]|uniref:DUF1508 domain-containing protein n=1 Tax=Actinokineospora globicatena TaxID=103729 RepID=A0A9W6VCD9_9PSEU|nr:hypothetical protein [Actinokineospora globicatena]MCP2305084.1 hypothetical protein [Actinokineospora globicatena]GLW80549.1 hypothetical protein Aglo01_50300 [Actinokineospora globicatena]GLW87377.1 hypothetical protein Aglo02_50160 [Actinokineospora globicatena]GLW93903.1 hypothetical protein Aglo03_47190 [Actinokineospora globicatena]
MAVARFQIYRSADDAVTWRFLSANNRSLGQAAQRFVDADACSRAMVELRAKLTEISATTARETPSQLWSWRVRLAGLDLAVSSRKYHRRVQAQYACRSFLGLVADAQLADLPRVVHF